MAPNPPTAPMADAAEVPAEEKKKTKKEREEEFAAKPKITHAMLMALTVYAPSPPTSHWITVLEYAPSAHVIGAHAGSVLMALTQPVRARLGRGKAIK
eukprot:1180354-Prorocentrum_minimum.AAC.1